MKKLSVSCAVCALLSFSTFSVQASSEDWPSWLAPQIEQHPDIAAAREQLSGSMATADATDQPLHNPELSSELERNGEANNFRIGVQQTIDWWDRRNSRQEQAVFIREAAEAQYRQLVMDKTAEVLTALVEWRAANRAAAIATAQKDHFETLLELARKRQNAGDISSIDAELTVLSLSQQLAEVAETEVALLMAESRLRELLPEWSPELGGIPEDDWPAAPASLADEDLLAHPAVASTRADWQALKEAAEAIRRAAKAEPTIGVNAGRDGGENVVALTFSVPLNVRNDFSAETRAANSAALEAEARFQAVFRKQRFELQAAQAAWQRYKEQYSRWQAVAQNHVKNGPDLLERQWRSGDLSTADYLQALNQRSQSLLAGIALEKQSQLALTQVLLQSGYLNMATVPPTVQTN
ncbi:MAG: ABC transporter permease [unclassified Hahellaceae]|nr:ABC transporter permease [Hahellaceae bacterium]|tara:strand:+ start:4901 stop:6133 length:1233 start_codon:yes stop_codon:yes gene_type:complete